MMGVSDGSVVIGGNAFTVYLILWWQGMEKENNSGDGW